VTHSRGLLLEPQHIPRARIELVDAASYAAGRHNDEARPPAPFEPSHQDCRHTMTKATEQDSKTNHRLDDDSEPICRPVLGSRMPPGIVDFTRVSSRRGGAATGNKYEMSAARRGPSIEICHPPRSFENRESREGCGLVCHLDCRHSRPGTEAHCRRLSARDQHAFGKPTHSGPNITHWGPNRMSHDSEPRAELRQRDCNHSARMTRSRAGLCQFVLTETRASVNRSRGSRSFSISTAGPSDSMAARP
jgi:hypothetical protein